MIPVDCVTKVSRHTFSHVLHGCKFTATVVNGVFSNMENPMCVGTFEDQCSMMCKVAARKNDISRLRLMLYSEALYAIWIARNSRVFYG